MNLIENIKTELSNNSKMRIILPEASDKRILKAANNILSEDLINIIFIGEKNIIYPNLSKAEWINPKELDLNPYIEKLYEIRKDKGLTKEEAKRLLLEDNMYLSCLLLIDNKADGIVSGIMHSTSNTLRPALQLIKGKDKLVSSFFIMDLPNKELGENGLFIYSDCGLIQNPSSSELALIAKQSLNSFETIIKKEPKLAFLSHSTYGSSKHEMVDKVKEATEIAKKENPNYLIDGELQLDAAIIEEISNIKAPNSPLKGHANILIFPDIDSGNISYKITERMGLAKAYGPLTQGLNKQVNDLSRASTIEDIEGVIIITALQATKNMI